MRVVDLRIRIIEIADVFFFLCGKVYGKGGEVRFELRLDLGLLCGWGVRIGLGISVLCEKRVWSWNIVVCLIGEGVFWRGFLFWVWFRVIVEYSVRFGFGDLGCLG